MNKFFSLSIGLLFLVLLISGCAPAKPPSQEEKLNLSNIKPEFEKQIALSKANQLYNQVVAENRNLFNGPCLSNELHGNPDYPETMWVLDIVQQPRSKADDLPENQCSAFNEGKAKHIIEMTSEGQLIKIE